MRAALLALPCLALVACQPRAAEPPPNRKPVIGDLSFRPGKFVRACEPVEICVTATDPDGDRLTVGWRVLGDGAGLEGPTETSSHPEGEGHTACAQFLARRAAAFELEVHVADGPAAERGVVLHDTLRFPLYAAEPTRPCPP